MILAQFAAGTRLMYAMGRDGVLPRRFFAYISPCFRTPIRNLLLTGAVGFIAIALTVSTSTSFVNFGAFCACAFVNISVLVAYAKAVRAGDRPNPIT